MPEDFSRDFPADDMVELVKLTDANQFSKFGGVLILQRYWDFSSSGMFKKKYGTLQMTMTVKQIEEGHDIDLANPVDLIKVISKDLKKTYSESNNSKNDEDKVRYSNLEGDFIEFKFNNQRWVRYSIWKDNDSELTSLFAITISKMHYLFVAFSFAPVNKISMREFIDEYAQHRVNDIMETVRIKYDLSNPLNKQLDSFSQQKLSE